jgi:hypothetical protein
MRRFVSNLRMLTLSAALAVLALAGLSTALAATATGSQDQNVPVKVTISPDTLVRGQPMTLSCKVTNNTTTSQTLTAYLYLTFPGGRKALYYETSQAVSPGKSFTFTQRPMVHQSGFPSGTYTLTGYGRLICGESSATVTATLP